jgi:hypothetical protein
MTQLHEYATCAIVKGCTLRRALSLGEGSAVTLMKVIRLLDKRIYSFILPWALQQASPVGMRTKGTNKELAHKTASPGCGSISQLL